MDVSFFTTAAGPGAVSTAVKSTKVVSKAAPAKPPSQAAPAPVDLIPLGRGSPTKAGKTVRVNVDSSAADPKTSPQAKSPATDADAAVGQKRPAAHPLPPRPPPAARAQQQQQQQPQPDGAPHPKPKKPLMKKPKQPPSLFINKVRTYNDSFGLQFSHSSL